MILLLQTVMGTFSSVFIKSLRDTFLVQMTNPDVSVRKKATVVKDNKFARRFQTLSNLINYLEV